jgi:hypothetical protein
MIRWIRRFRPATREIQIWLFLAFLMVVAGGCVTRQHSEFRGVVSRGGMPTNAPPVQEIGGEIGYAGEDSTVDAVWVFDLSGSGGAIVLVYDRKKVVNRGYKISNDTLSAVYFDDRGQRDEEVEKWESFVGLDVAARDRLPGVHRLKGHCDVEKWKSNGDFRVRLSMRSAGPDPIVVNGILASYDRMVFDPGTWCVGALMVFGVATGLSR